MSDSKVAGEIRTEFQHSELPVGDVVGEVLGGLTEMASDLAKEKLCERHGLPPGSLDEKPGPLPKNSVLRQAKTLEELGPTDPGSTPAVAASAGSHEDSGSQTSARTDSVFG